VAVPLISGETSPRGRAAPPHPVPVIGCWISGIRPRSGGLDLIRTVLISIVRWGFSSSTRSAHPRPACEPCLGSLTPRAHLSALAARPRLRVRPQDLISTVRSGSCNSEYSIPLHMAVLRKRPSGSENQPTVLNFST
jgi:hypothetical protein